MNLTETLSTDEIATLGHILTKLDKSNSKEKRLTVGDLFTHYLRDHAKPNLKTWRNMERCFNSYFGKLRQKDCLSLKRVDVQRWYNELCESPGETTANRAFQLLRSVYYKCIDWELIPNYNPAARISIKKLQSRERFLLPEELPRFFAACTTIRYPTVRDFFLMCLFTGQRAGNVRQMRWDQISLELKIWTIPITKNGTSHKVPLTPHAMALLKTRYSSRKSDWVFPGFLTNQGDIDPDRPLGKNGCRDAWVNLVERAELSNLRLHDLRRTHASYQAITGANLTTIAHTLNHKDLSSTQIYARLHLDPIRDAMNTALNTMFHYAGIDTGDDDQEHVLTLLAPALTSQEDRITSAEASAIMGISEKSLQTMRYKRQGPPYQKDGYCVYYSRTLVSAWMYGRKPIRAEREELLLLALGEPPDVVDVTEVGEHED